jgi:acetyltransferase-like isoleucine patch superfamily enzyme
VNATALLRDALVGLTHRAWYRVRWAGAIGPRDAMGRRFAAFGDGSIIAFPPGDSYNEQHIALGRDTTIAAHVSLSVGLGPGLPLFEGAVSPVLRIGDRCSIGRGSHLVAHRSLVVGDDVITGPHVYLTDQNHVYADPERPVREQWPTSEGVEIGRGSWLGVGCVILPGTRLGRNTVVAAGAVVQGTFPDHAVLAGIPAKVVRSLDASGSWAPPLREPPPEAPSDWH